MLWIWSSQNEKKQCIGDCRTSWGLASICQKEKNGTKPSNALVVQAHLAILARKLAHPRCCDDSKHCSKRHSHFEQPLLEIHLPFCPQISLWNTSLPDQMNFLHLCRKCASNDPVRPNAKPHWQEFFPTQKTENEICLVKWHLNWRPDWDLNGKLRWPMIN